MARLFIAVTIVAVLAVSAQAEVCHLDLSPWSGTRSLNYDVFASEGEYLSAGPGVSIRTAMGSHSASYSSCKREAVTWGSVGPGGIAGNIITTPSSTYALASFGRSWAPGDVPLTRADINWNTMRMDTTTMGMYSISLGSQAGKFQNLNMLCNLLPFITGGTNYKVAIAVDYAEGYSAVYETARMPNVPDSAPIGGVWTDATSNTFLNTATGRNVTWTATQVCSTYLNEANEVTPGNRYMFDIEGGLPLDPDKTLEGIVFTWTTDSPGRGFEVQLHAISLTPVPEPATVGLLSLGVTAVLVRRRGRRTR